MTKNPFQMFSTEEDHYNWDRYDEQLDHIEVSQLDRARARKAIRYFRTLLGEDFLREARQTAHPMLSILKNPAPRERLFMAELAEMMIALENAGKFGDVLRRIRNPKEAEEALSVIPVAHKFFLAGFSVGFEPDVEVTHPPGIKRPKKPDMKITNNETHEEVFVEVSRLLAGDKQLRSRETFDALQCTWEALIRDDPEATWDFQVRRAMRPYIRFYSGMDDEELRAVISQVHELAASVKRTNEFEELIVKDLIEVGIAPYDDHETADQWAAARNMTQPVEGPPIDTDEVSRACRKILKEKVWQIPDEGPGIIVLPTDNNLILFTHDPRYIISAIEQAIATQPKVFCVVLTLVFGISDQTDPVVATLGDHMVLCKTRQDGATECAVIIRNPQCKVTLKPKTIEKVIHAFKDY